MAREPLVEVDLGSADSPHALHQRLADALHFPSWYGHNWDAFWDAITSLVEMPRTLRLRGWRQLAARLPREAALLRQCLDDLSQQHPDLAPQVEYA